MSSHQHHDHAGHDHAGHDHAGHDHAGHEMHGMQGDLRSMAASATLHCLTGCAIGEILGLILGTALGLGTVATIALAVSLAFLFGYALSTLPLLKSGLAVGTALSVVLAADTLSIATMEIVDNAVMAAIPGAMEAGLTNPVFWAGMMLALSVAFVAAYPVNLYLLRRGKGHALTHGYHGGEAMTTGVRRWLPSIATSTLAAALVSFMLGGLLVAATADQGDEPGDEPSHGAPAAALTAA